MVAERLGTELLVAEVKDVITAGGDVLVRSTRRAGAPLLAARLWLLEGEPRLTGALADAGGADPILVPDSRAKVVVVMDTDAAAELCAGKVASKFKGPGYSPAASLFGPGGPAEKSKSAASSTAGAGRLAPLLAKAACDNKSSACGTTAFAATVAEAPDLIAFAVGKLGVGLWMEAESALAGTALVVNSAAVRATRFSPETCGCGAEGY